MHNRRTTLDCFHCFLCLCLPSLQQWHGAINRGAVCHVATTILLVTDAADGVMTKWQRRKGLQLARTGSLQSTSRLEKPQTLEALESSSRSMRQDRHGRLSWHRSHIWQGSSALRGPTCRQPSSRCSQLQLPSRVKKGCPTLWVSQVLLQHPWAQVLLQHQQQVQPPFVWMMMAMLSLMKICSRWTCSWSNIRENPPFSSRAVWRRP